jgi:glycine hydroxymethyltransferase
VADELENEARRRWLEAVAPVYRGETSIEEEYAVNVQAPTGSIANVIVYFAVLQPGDTVMGLKIAHGGHLTHGYPLNISGRVFRSVQFGVNLDTGEIDYDAVRALALKERPRLLMIGTTAYTYQLDTEKLRTIADEVTAANTAEGKDAPMLLAVDVAHPFTQILGGDYPSPFGLADFVTLTPHKSQGPRSGLIYARKRAFPSVNAHMGIPEEKRRVTTLADLVDRAVIPGLLGGPKLAEIASKNVQALYFGTPEFQAYARQIGPNAKVLAAALLAQDSRVRLVGGGTRVHLILWDVRPFGLMGLQAEKALASVGILANRNMIPVDEMVEAQKPRSQRQSPIRPAGIRLGVPALTARGMKEPEMREIAQLLVETLRDTDPATGEVNPAVKESLRVRVAALTVRFPVHSELRALLHRIQEEPEGAAGLEEGLGVLKELKPSTLQRWEVHIFDPETADVGRVVAAVQSDPVVIIAEDWEHQRELLNSGFVGEDRIILQLDLHDNDIVKAREAAARLYRDLFSPQYYKAEQRGDRLMIWLAGVLERYDVPDSILSLEGARQLVEQWERLRSA